MHSEASKNPEGYAIDVHHLSKSFNGKKVVDDVNIQVPRGKIYGFLGPNGSGKTTTIRLICGLLTADNGEGSCLGYDVRKDFEQIRGKIGYMTQKFSFWEDLTIRENIEFVADLYGLDHPQKRVHAALEGLGLSQRQKQLAGSLSGGWKQRLALACCILHEPELLLLDEPTAGVDPKARREFWDEIHKLAAQGLTVLVSTHYMDEAERCHAIIYITNGRIMTRGTVEEVVHNAGLTTWIVRGQDLTSLRQALENHPAVSAVAPFGDCLHVNGTDATALAEAIAPYQDSSPNQKSPLYQWEPAEASMEDAFIHYMAEAEKTVNR